MEQGVAVASDDWFSTPYLLTVRPVAGTDDAALLVEDHPDGSRARIWRPGAPPDDLLPFDVAVGAVLTSDCGWVVDLDDGGGSEVGGLVACSTDGTTRIELTPGREPYVLRGLEQSFDGSTIVATIVDEQGFHVLLIPARPWGPPRQVYSSPIEAWYGLLSADAGLVSVDTTDHNPGVRRPAVTVLDTATSLVIGVLDDLPDGPVRAVRFSRIPGDERLLVSTERSGFARPAIWNPRTGARRDFPLPDIRGEVLGLDWSADSGRVLAVSVEDGIQALLELDESDGSARTLLTGGSFADPDVADLHPYQWASYLAPDGSVRAARSSWDRPLHIVGIDADGGATTLVVPAVVPTGVPLTSTMVPSADGTRVQVWLGRPRGDAIGTVLAVHGGPNLVTIDDFDSSTQAWIEAGFAVASLNYRGSVTFGTRFREGFWGSGGDREIEDVDAAVRWLRSEGLADPSTTFITGASFGGHLTLLSLGRLPEHFAGGFAHVAVAEWSAAIAGMNPAVRGVWTTWVPPGMVGRYSALTYTERVAASVWINQGALDTRTPLAGVRRFVDELTERGGDVVLDVFDGGHEPTGLRMLQRDQARMADFAMRTLSGRRWSAP